jgi:hypothetical protein
MFGKALPLGPPRGKRSLADRRTPAFVAVLAQSNRSRSCNTSCIARKTLGERQLTCTQSSRIQAHLPARGRGSSSRLIEGSNGKFASRQRSPFIAIHGH